MLAVLVPVVKEIYIRWARVYQLKPLDKTAGNVRIPVKFWCCDHEPKENMNPVIVVSDVDADTSVKVAPSSHKHPEDTPTKPETNFAPFPNLVVRAIAGTAWQVQVPGFFFFHRCSKTRFVFW